MVHSDNKQADGQHVDSRAEALVQQIHTCPGRIVLAVTGGGSRAIGLLLSVAGASRTLLEANVPYADAALTEYLGHTPDQSCGARTARAMAMTAFLRGRELCRTSDSSPSRDSGGVHAVAEPILGVACSASLASNRPKRGEHRIHLAVQALGYTRSVSIVLAKGRRTRAEEEWLATQAVLNEVALAKGLDLKLDLGLAAEDRCSSDKIEAHDAWQDVLVGDVDAVWVEGPEGDRDHHCSGLIFPGAFDPLHDGHREMAALAEQRLGRPVEFEISLWNVDKPPLNYADLFHRVDQFAQTNSSLWLTRAPTFAEKSALFPNATFVVGADTILRIGDSKYYGGLRECREAIYAIRAAGCRFLVFGRLDGGDFHSGEDSEMPEELRALCTVVPADQFRNDISSTQLRR